MVLSTLFRYILAFRYRLNGFLLTLYLRSLGCKVAPGLRALRLPTFKEIPSGNIQIGKNVSMGRGIIFEITSTGSLTIGDGCTLGDYGRYSSTHPIRLGKAVAIAEHVSIRGSFHNTSRSDLIVNQDSHGAEIEIGHDVLIGTHSVLLLGAFLPDGVVIGAHSLVVKGDNLTAYGIFAGSPLKHIRNRA